MLAETNSAALAGIEALPIQVEVNTDLEGDPKLFIVGQINLTILDKVLKSQNTRTSAFLRHLVSTLWKSTELQTLVSWTI